MRQTHESCSEVHESVVPRVWDTRHVPLAEAWEFYRDGVCSAFMPLRPERPGRSHDEFRSQHASYVVGDVTLNAVSASPHPVFKGPSEIAASEAECVYLNLQLAGRCRVTQGGETVELRAGQVAMFDSGHPFAMDHGETESLRVISMMIPRDRLAYAGSPRPLMLSDHPRYGSALRQAMAAFGSTGHVDLGDSIFTLRDVVLGLAELALTSESSVERPGTRREAHYFRMCELIRSHCHLSSLRLEQIAALIGVSVGTARNVFTQHDDTFGRRLLAERLRLAQQLLRDERSAHLSVAEVAYRCGFSDPAHFGRSFKASVGVPPGAWRRGQSKS